MRPHEDLARAKRVKRWRRALQLATCASVLVLSCSVYDSSLLAGRDSLQGADGGAGAGSALAGAGQLPTAGQSGQAGEPSVPAGGDAGSTGEPEPERGGASFAGTSAGGGAGAGEGGAVSAGGALAGGTGASNAGAAGSAATVRELGKGKSATASTAQPANTVAMGNDGESATRWCATTAAVPQWWRVDLGAAHQLTQVVIKFEHPERLYSYTVETSADDVSYTQRGMALKGTGDAQTVNFAADVSGRYVRITVTEGVPYTDSTGKVNPTWASFWELRVYGY